MQTICSFYLVEMVAMGPHSVGTYFTSKQEWIMSFIFSPKLDTKVSMARLLGIVGTMNLAGNSSQATFSLMLERLVQKMNSSVQDESHGSILGLGYLIGKLKYRYKSLDGFLSTEIEASIISTISDSIVNSEKPDLVFAACLSISEIARYAPFSDSLLL